MNDPKLLHPAPEQLADYGLGRLSEPDSAAVYDHLEVCAECRRTVETLPDDTLASLVRAATVPGLPPGPGGERGASPAGNTLLPDPTPQGGGTVAYSPDQGSRAPDPSATAPAPRDDVSRAAGPSAAAVGDTEHIPAPLLDHPRYRIVELLGAGGMGSVYQAEHLLMGRTVALKVIARQFVARPATLERFRREVRAAARLAHPNIVHAYDAEQAGDSHFLVMEFVEGASLDRVVQERGPLPVAEACDYARQAALGLEHAFRRGMVHRDVKPHNLMLTPEGQVKVLDFGLARFASENLLASPLTEAGTVMGTPDYIAPEQARDAHSADIRADLYSLGCTLYFLLTGQPPFPEGTYVQKLAAHLERAPRPLSELRRDLPPGLARIVQRMMAKDPAQRYQTPAEVAEALAPFARPAEVPARPGRRRWPLVAAAVLLGLLGVGTYLFAPAVYRFATNQGEVVIETDDPDVEVSVKHGGKQIEILDGKTKRKVTLQAGTYQVALTEGKEGLRLSTKQFTLERGGREIVKVRLEEGAWAKGHAAEKGRDTEPAQGRPGERHEDGTLPPPLCSRPRPGRCWEMVARIGPRESPGSFAGRKSPGPAITTSLS